MRKINTLGIESANKIMLMAAMSYNLKKHLKHKRVGILKPEIRSKII